MKIRLAGIVEDSIVDGPGNRMTVFAQGCPHHCPGCHNPETHDFASGYLENTENVIARMRANPLLTGLTLSGGEPFCQPEASRVLADAAHGMGLNVWIYTGYCWEQLLAEADTARLSMLQAADVLVDGPFLIQERSLELFFRGSANQRLIDIQSSFRDGRVIEWKPRSMDDWEAL